VHLVWPPLLQVITCQCADEAVAEKEAELVVEHDSTGDEEHPSLRPAMSVREWQDKLLRELHWRLRNSHAELERPWRTRDPSARWRGQRCVVNTRMLGKVHRLKRLQRCASRLSHRASWHHTHSARSAWHPHPRYHDIYGWRWARSCRFLQKVVQAGKEELRSDGGATTAQLPSQPAAPCVSFHEVCVDVPEWVQQDLRLVISIHPATLKAQDALARVTSMLREIAEADARARRTLLQSRLRHVQKLRGVFDAVDKDGSGEVTREEFRKYMASAERRYGAALPAQRLACKQCVTNARVQSHAQ
jgi:EF hand